MILGIGTDIVETARIASLLQSAGARFLARSFTEEEQALALKRGKDGNHCAATLAKRFAAKEACAKALGTGLRGGVFWRDMGVVNLPSGRPTMKLTGGALKRLQEITPPGHKAQIDLTITDDGPTAQAIVIISAVPLASAVNPA